MERIHRIGSAEFGMVSLLGVEVNIVSTLRLFCSQALEMGWLFLSLAVPLYFNPLVREPFESAKSSLLRWITIAILLILIVEYLGDVRDKPERSTQSIWRAFDRLRLDNPLSLPAIALALAYLLASATSLEPETSFWASRHQASGTLMILCYTTIFLIVGERLESRLQSHRLVGAILLGSAPIAIYGILQQMGIDIWVWETDSVSRSLSTLGRSNYLGAYLAMVIPLTTGMLLLAQQPAFLAGYSILLTLQTICLLLTNARAAWLALMMAIPLFFWLMFRHRASKRVHLLAMPALLIPAITIVLGAAFSEASARSRSILWRLVVWRVTLDMIADRWLTGYGPGTFFHVFVRYYPQRWRRWGSKIVLESAHNGLLDIGASTGVIGLATYGWFVFRLYHLGFRAIRESDDTEQLVLLSACLASLLAFHVQDFFTPSVISTQLLFWLLAALLVRLSRYPPANANMTK